MKKIILTITALMLFANDGLFAQDNRTDTTQVQQDDSQSIPQEGEGEEVEGRSVAATQAQAVNPTTSDSQQTQIWIAYCIAGLALLLAAFAIWKVLQEKNNFRDNVLNLLDDDGDRMNRFIDRIAREIKSSIPANYNQPAKINEEDVKRIVYSYLEARQAETQRQQEQKRIYQQSLPQTLYADAIIGGRFNRVKEQPDANESNFELRLARASDTTAKVAVYPDAYRRILANPSFLEGCEKQIMSNSPTSVATTREGVAQKDGDGKWRITTTPEVRIS